MMYSILGFITSGLIFLLPETNRRPLPETIREFEASLHAAKKPHKKNKHKKDTEKREALSCALESL